MSVDSYFLFLSQSLKLGVSVKRDQVPVHNCETGAAISRSPKTNSIQTDRKAKAEQHPCNRWAQQHQKQPGASPEHPSAFEN